MESMTKQVTPSDLPPSSPALVSIQNEVREYFGWTEEDDIESQFRCLEGRKTQPWESRPDTIGLQLYQFSEES